MSVGMPLIMIGDCSLAINCLPCVQYFLSEYDVPVFIAQSAFEYSLVSSLAFSKALTWLLLWNKSLAVDMKQVSASFGSVSALISLVVVVFADPGGPTNR